MLRSPWCAPWEGYIMALRSNSASYVLFPLIIIHNAGLLVGIKHSKCLLGKSGRECVYGRVSSFGCMYAVYWLACVQLAHLRLGDWKNKFGTHLILTIRSEVTTFLIVLMMFHCCAPEVTVPPYSVIEFKFKFSCKHFLFKKHTNIQVQKGDWSPREIYISCHSHPNHITR